MNAGLRPFVYRFFDRHVVSDLELALLQPLPPGTEPSTPPIRLMLASESFTPVGQAVLDGPAMPMSIFFDGQEAIFILHEAQLAAVVAPDGLSIMVHPLPGRAAVSEAELSHRLGDRLVTTVLSRLPILWGNPALHGATLSWEAGSILLLGESGVGKSTLSQHLVRDYGATLHDDDTAMVDDASGAPTPIPMGGAARLRKDAASDLGLEGVALPGFSGGKIALSHILSPHFVPLPPLRALCEIVALPSRSAPAQSSGPLTELIDPVRALATVWGHVFTTNLEKGQRVQRFRVAQSVVNVPLTRITYARDEDSPQSVARIIGEIAESFPGKKKDAIFSNVKSW